MADLSVKLCGIPFKNPIIGASGIFGFGKEYDQLVSIEEMGGISVKGLTLETRIGNPPPRIAETPMGILNSVGLQNPGVKAFVKKDLPWLLNKDVTIIANIAGKTVEDYCAVTQIIDDTPIDMIELNISCPNVQNGGMAFGTTCASASQVTAEVRKLTNKPLIVKLSPNVSDIAVIAKAVESSGADAVSLINTLVGMRININTRRPILYNNIGGLSGPAVFPVAVRMVREVYKAVKIPVIGMGGISTWQDAVEIMMAGAAAIQIGTIMFNNCFAPIEIAMGINEFLDKNNIASVSDIVGTVNEW